jgi:tRNA (guanine37-N1)-methyltransferase
MWRASILTIFPEMFPGPLGSSLAGKALTGGLWSLDTVDIRAHATDRHRTVDDTPAGGGPGMVMKADVLARALDAASSPDDTRPRLLMTPRGMPLTQARVATLSRGPGAVILCGRFEASTSASSRRAIFRRSRSAIMCCRAARSPPSC